MKKWSYLFVYSLPVTVYVAFNVKGVLTFLPIFIFYGLVPLFELMTKPDSSNPEDLDSLKRNRFYDFLLYLSVPVQVIFLFYFLHVVSVNHYTTLEYIGISISMGLMCGVFGINIAHELGHRQQRFEQLLAEILLLTSLEMHFLPYHNSGHHKNVGTRKDPATARKGEPVYVFWFRSQIGSYFQAWSLEAKRLKKRNMTPYSLKNRAFAYTIIQLVFIGAIYYFYGLLPLSLFTIASVFGILLLETVNYIEHYGLMRTQNESGYYERVMHEHSWNSDHPIGRAMLFELSRHSDHHYKASKKYQILESLPGAPQMPTGYPGMMLFSLIPPLWFKVMNKKLSTLQL